MTYRRRQRERKELSKSVRSSPIRDGCDLRTLRSIGQTPTPEDKAWLRECTSPLSRNNDFTKYKTLTETAFRENSPPQLISDYINKGYTLTKDDYFMRQMIKLLELEERVEDAKELKKYF